MSKLSIQEALDYCLENPDGLTVQEMLSRFPQYRAELADMLGLARELTAITPPPLPDRSREAMKTRLMLATMEQAAAAQLTKPTPITKPTRPANPRPWFVSPGWIAAAAALLILLFVWWSADHALPDNPLYNVKIASENLILNLTGDPADKAVVSTKIANARLYDVRAMEEAGKLAQAAPALESYSNKVTSAETILQALQPGEPRIRVASATYLTGSAGKSNFENIEDLIEKRVIDITNYPVAFAENLRLAEIKTDEIVAVAGNTLRADGINPEDLDIDNYIALLLTPVAVRQNTPTPVATTAITATSPQSTATTQPTIDLTAIVITNNQTPTETPDTQPAASSTPSQSQPTLTPAIVVTSTTAPPNTPLPQASPTTQIQRTPTLRPTDVATTTPVRPTSTSIPGIRITPTPFPPPVTATSVVIGQEPTSTPAAAPSSTPTGAVPPTQPPPSTPILPTIPPVGPPDSTNTPVPVPTSTPTYTPTHTPTPTYTPTDTPTPTYTPTDTPTPVPTLTEPPPPTVCDLNLTMVTARCESAVCASWMARIRNEGSGPVEADWVAELWTRTGSGGFMLSDTISDTITVDAGADIRIGDGYLFCDSFPPNTIQFQVRVHLVTNGAPCNSPPKSSSTVAACHSN